MRPSKFTLLLLLMLISSILLGCKEEEPLPAIRREFGLIQNKPELAPPLFYCDNGDTYLLKNTPSLISEGSTFRCLVFFYPTEENGKQYATIMGTPAFISMYQPLQLEEEYIETDPLRLESIWKEGNFINFNLMIKSATEQHVLGLINKGIVTNNNGDRILQVLLYHDNMDDDFAFRKRIYISLPTYYYTETLRAGQDSIYCTINTEKEGFKTWKFVY